MLLLLILGVPCAALAQAPGMTNDVPGALPGIHIIAPVANGQWTMPAGEYGNTRYNPLNQINSTNVQNLHIVATMSTGIPHGHEGGPLVVGKMLYIVTPFPNKLMALEHSARLSHPLPKRIIAMGTAMAGTRVVKPNTSGHWSAAFASASRSRSA